MLFLLDKFIKLNSFFIIFLNLKNKIFLFIVYNIFSMFYSKDNVDNDFIFVNDLYMYLYYFVKIINYLCFYFFLIKGVRVIYVFFK